MECGENHFSGPCPKFSPIQPHQWFGTTTLAPAKRNYKCGQCNSEFDKGNILTEKEIKEGRKFCPFCDIENRRKKRCNTNQHK